MDVPRVVDVPHLAAASREDLTRAVEALSEAVEEEADSKYQLCTLTA